MPEHAESIIIERPLRDVFAYMDDISREREWQPYLLETEQVPPGPTAVGTRRRYVSVFVGKRVENTYVVKAYEPERRVTLESTPDSAVRGATEIRWQAVGDHTRVTMSMEGEPAGMLRFVPRALLEGAFAREIRVALGRLKERLESGDEARP